VSVEVEDEGVMETTTMVKKRKLKSLRVKMWATLKKNHNRHDMIS
jgi:hypothetical protein